MATTQQTADETQAQCVSYDIHARYYDLVYADQSEVDLAFYLELAAQQPGPVLELGCGTGRIALALAAAGHEVWALDISPAMLAVLERKRAALNPEAQARVHPLLGDMACFELPLRFGLIISPFRAMMHLLEGAQQRACLEHIAAQLAPGGRYVHDMFVPNLAFITDAMRRGAVWVLDHECKDAAQGRIIRRYFMARHEPVLQLNRLSFKYEEYDLAGRLLATQVEQADMRWMYCYEAEYLFELCGLAVETAYGSYAKTPLGAGARDMLYVCRAAH